MSAPPIITQGAPPAGPPRPKSNTLPIMVALAALIGGCLGVVGLGAWFYSFLSGDPTPAREVSPRVVEDRGDGWSLIKLETVGLTLELPAIPVRADKKPSGEDISLYRRYARYQATADIAVVRIIAYAEKIAGMNTPEELADMYTERLKQNPSYNVIRSSVVSFQIANHWGRKIDLEYDYLGKRYTNRTVIFIEGSVEYYIQIDPNNPEEMDALADRVYGTCTFSESGSMMTK